MYNLLFITAHTSLGSSVNPAATETSHYRGCGVKDKTPEEASLLEADFLAKKQLRSSLLTDKDGGTISAVVINVYMHIITDSNGNGDLSDGIITAQIDVLNAAFSSSGFSFVEVGRDVTVSNILLYFVLSPFLTIFSSPMPG